MSHLYKAQPLDEGYNLIVGPENAELKMLEFGRLLLSEAGKSFEEATGNREVAITIYSGKCMVEVLSPTEVKWEEIGGRADAFSGKPSVVYIPRDAEYRITAQARLEAGMFKAPAEKKTAPALVTPDDLIATSAGAGNWRREVWTAIGPNVEASTLLMGETLNPPGYWSSYPPHKHDTHAPPQEAPYEEVYFFQVKPKQGFGIQRVYTGRDAPDPLDEVYVIEDGDTVVIPRGYHPVAAAPGYQVHYSWALAGEGRTPGAWSDDPKHAWVKGCESILKELTAFSVSS